MKKTRFMLTGRLKNSIKDYPDFPKKDIIFKDISPILADPNLFSDLIEKISKTPLLSKADAIIAIDARGFIFGSALAKTIQKPLIMARKKNKLPGKLLEKKYGLEYGEDLLSIQEESLNIYNTFILVDDLLATGGTAKCISDLIESKNKKVVGLSVVIELEELNGKEKLPFEVDSQIKFA